MRTKALLCAAALAAGIGSTMAQVYSLNVVGYYNVTVPAGKQLLIANQLNTTNNTIGSLLPTVPPGSQLFKYTTGSGYGTWVYDDFDLVWYHNGVPDSSATLNPGEGAFFKNSGASPLTLTFVGEVMQGNLTNALPNGFSIRSSMVPQSVALDTVGFPGVPGDQIFFYDPTTGYSTYVFDDFDLVWYNNGVPKSPTPDVGQAFFVNKNGAANWVRNFTVQ